MKKFLGFIALAVLVILPIKASAATRSISFVDNGDFDADTGYFTVTVKGTQSGGSSITDPIQSTMTLTNVEYVDGEEVVNGSWNVYREGTTLTFTPSVAVSDSSFTIVTLKFKKIDANAECGVLFQCNDVTKKITPGKVTNPKTGSALPYAVIMSGIVIACGVYYVTRKNAKLYKI